MHVSVECGFFCRKTIRVVRCRVVSSALTTELSTQHHTGVQCDNLGSIKACRMRQRLFVFNADPKRLKTLSIFQTPSSDFTKAQPRLWRYHRLGSEHLCHRFLCTCGMSSPFKVLSYGDAKHAYVMYDRDARRAGCLNGWSCKRTRTSCTIEMQVAPNV